MKKIAELLKAPACPRQNFADSPLCRGRALCGLCRLQTPAGRAWRKMAAERYEIPGNRTESGELAVDAADFCCILPEPEKKTWIRAAQDTPAKRAIRRACCEKKT